MVVMFGSQPSCQGCLIHTESWTSRRCRCIMWISTYGSWNWSNQVSLQHQKKMPNLPCEISILYPACVQFNTKRIASQQKNKKNGNEILASNVCRTLPKHSWHSHSSLLQNQAQPAYPKHAARSLCSTAIGVTKRRRCLAWLRPVEEVEISVNIYIYMYICINIYIIWGLFYILSFINPPWAGLARNLRVACATQVFG